MQGKQDNDQVAPSAQLRHTGKLLQFPELACSHLQNSKIIVIDLAGVFQVSCWIIQKVLLLGIVVTSNALLSPSPAVVAKGKMLLYPLAFKNGKCYNEGRTLSWPQLPKLSFWQICRHPGYSPPCVAWCLLHCSVDARIVFCSTWLSYKHGCIID